MKQSISLRRPSLFVAVPAYGGSIKTKCAVSLLALQAWAAQAKIAFTIQALDSPGITEVRNVLAAQFLLSSCSHLLFIDSDMTFKPETVAKLTAAQKPLIGCLYPKRRLDLRRAVAMSNESAAFTPVLHGEPRNHKDGMCQVDGIGMGITLIERRVFTDMLATGKVTTYRDFPGLNGKPVYGFFDKFDTRSYLSEDLAFCSRWREHCRGEVWVLTTEPIGHIGDYDFMLSPVGHE